MDTKIAALRARLEDRHSSDLPPANLKLIVALEKSELLYEDMKPKVDLKHILQTCASLIPSKFPVPLVNFLKEKLHVHFEYKSPPLGMRRLGSSNSDNIPSDYTHFPPKKIGIFLEW